MPSHGGPAGEHAATEGDGAGRLERRTTAGGRLVHVDAAAGTRGSLGAFYPAYLDPHRERRYGWFCANCGSTDAAMDPMGRIGCNRCGNRRKATRWDAAYL